MPSFFNLMRNKFTKCTEQIPFYQNGASHIRLSIANKMPNKEPDNERDYTSIYH